MGKAASDDAPHGAPAERGAVPEDDAASERNEGESERNRVVARSSELRSAAVAKSGELRSQAAAKSGELRSAAAAKRSAAAAKGSELRSSAANRAAEVQQTIRDLDVPWARCRLARLARESILQFVFAPLMELYTRMRVSGRDQFRHITPPVVLVANHSSHLDTPTILRALPLRWRQRTAVAAAADYFYKSRAIAGAVALAFNTVPILRRGGGMGNGSLDHVDKLLDQRWNLLMFPEGTRSREGDLGTLKAGAAVIAREHNIPIVPIRVEGTFEAMPPGQNWPRRRHGSAPHRHNVAVSFGPPIWPDPDEGGQALMERIRPFIQRSEIREKLHP